MSKNQLPSCYYLEIPEEFNKSYIATHVFPAVMINKVSLYGSMCNS